MSGATAPQPAIPGAPEDAVLAACEQVAAELRKTRAMLRDDETVPVEFVVLSRRLADLQAVFAAGAEQIRAAAVARGAQADIAREAQRRALAAVPDRRGRHRGSRQRDRDGQPPLMRPVPALIPAAALVARLWSAHRVLAPVAASALAASAVAAVTLPAMQHAPYYAPAVKAPAVVAYSAPPVLPPASHRARGKHHRRKAPAAAAATPSPSASPSPHASPLPSPGVLDVAEESVTLRPVSPGELTGSIDVAADGGPVSWSASAPGLSLGSSGGTLADGGVQVITVSVPSGQPAGSAVVTFRSGGATVQVPVTWGAPPS